MEEYVPVSAVELGSIRAAEPLGTIALPVRDFINTSTFLSILGMDRKGFPVDLLVVQGNVLTLQRNTLLSRMRGDWIMFIDDDMVWPPDAPKRLFQSLLDLEAAGHEADVLGALCFRRVHPYQPTLYVRDPKTKAYNFLEDWDERFVEVDATGMAFALITKRALERIAGSPQPPFEERVQMDKHPDFFRWQGSLGEDLRFCQDVRAAGGRVIVDTTIEISHVGDRRVGYADYLGAIRDREPEVTRLRRKLNRKMGLPTLSSVEANRRLREMASEETD